jgi:hypothetical protein
VHLIAGGISWSGLNQTVCALRFFYATTLGRTDLPERIAYARQPRKLPVVLSAGEVVRFLNAVANLRHRIALTTAYAAGLRAAEVASLKLADIESSRMVCPCAARRFDGSKRVRTRRKQHLQRYPAAASASHHPIDGNTSCQCERPNHAPDLPVPRPVATIPIARRTCGSVQCGFNEVALRARPLPVSRDRTEPSRFTKGACLLRGLCSVPRQLEISAW